MNKLSLRLLTIANFVKKDELIADIGADHGLVDMYLLANDIISKAFLVENKVGPFNRLKKNLSNYHDLIFSLSNGISELPSWVNTIVIAGMGENLVEEIISGGDIKNIAAFILEARGSSYKIRIFMKQLGFVPVNEVVIFEDHYYEIIRFERGNNDNSDLENYFGKINMENKGSSFIKLWEETQHKNIKILHKKLNQKRAHELSKENLRIEELWKVIN